jgi:putative ABC transport system ATP-binding protein
MKKPGVVIEAAGLTKIYRLGKENEVRALDGVDLEVKQGEMLAIIGASGSGKSTLLHLLGTLDSPTQGEVTLNGKSLFKQSRRARAKVRRTKIGMIFQHYNLISTLTALENVELPLRYAKLRRRERRKRAKAVLASLGMEDRMHHRPNELSGGQQQRVAVARALVTNPAVILADEPTGELDTRSSQQMMNILTQLNKKVGQTFVIVTHNPTVAALCDRVLEMQDGKVITERKRVRKA